MNAAANIPTPPAYDFTDEGLRIWIEGKPACVIKDNAHADLTHKLIKRMTEKAHD